MQGQRIPRAADLLPAWQSACVNVGLPEPNEHGVVLQDGTYAAAYASKWGLDCELTKSHVKRGNGAGRTAWDLLRASVDGDVDAGRLFQEHARAFKGRRQLVSSKGLRALLDLGIEKTDQELAVESTETAKEVATVSQWNWQRVLRYKARADLLIVAELHGEEGVTRFLRGLREANVQAKNSFDLHSLLLVSNPQSVAAELPLNHC